MKKIAYYIAGIFVTFTPQLASAQLATFGGGGPFAILLVNIIAFINNVLIPFIIAMGFLAFVWGMFKYFILGGSDDDKKVQGKSLMIHATMGFVIIIIFFGLVNMITSSTGLEGETLKNIPIVEIPNP